MSYDSHTRMCKESLRRPASFYPLDVFKGNVTGCSSFHAAQALDHAPCAPLIAFVRTYHNCLQHFTVRRA